MAYFKLPPPAECAVAERNVFCLSGSGSSFLFFVCFGAEFEEHVFMSFFVQICTLSSVFCVQLYASGTPGTRSPTAITSEMTFHTQCALLKPSSESTQHVVPLYIGPGIISSV